MKSGTHPAHLHTSVSKGEINNVMCGNIFQITIPMIPTSITLDTITDVEDIQVSALYVVLFKARFY